MEKRKSLASAGIRNPGISPVVSRYTDYATPAVINSLPTENVPLSIFLSINTDSVLQIRYNLPINDPLCDPRQSRTLHTCLMLV